MNDKITESERIKPETPVNRQKEKHDPNWNSYENEKSFSTVYLDNHSATCPLPSSIETMLSFYRQQWGVATSPHFKGQEVVHAYKKIQKQILESLGDAENRDFHFCSSGAEAINNAFFSHYFAKVRETGKNHIITGQLEIAPILSSLKRLEELGCAGKLLSVNEQGQITKEILLKALRPRTSFFSLSWAQGLTGVIHPIADLAEVCREKDIIFHVDASCILGKLYFDLEELSIDFLSFDGKLLRAPQNSGGLIYKKRASFFPLIAGQADVAVAPAAALAKSVLANASICDHVCLEIAHLRDKLEQEIKQKIPEAIIFFEHVERLPDCSVMSFPGISAETLLYFLHRQGIYASIGGGMHQRLSHILMACGVESKFAQSAISFTLSFETTEMQIDYVIDSLISCVEKLKKFSQELSPFKENT